MMPCQFRCVGGLAQVNGAYVDRMIREQLPEHAADEVVDHARLVLADSWYPCPQCRPEQYDLWRNGHLASGHTCDACVARRKGRAKVST